MRLVVVTGPGVVEFNWTWSPTFIGISNETKKELEAVVAPQLVGKELTEDLLDEAHDLVVNFLCEKYKLPGLRDYLDAIKYIDEKGAV